MQRDKPLPTIDSLSSEIRKVQISPCYDECNYKELSPKVQPSAVERADSGDHCFASFDYQFVSTDMKTSLRVHRGLRREKSFKGLLRRRLDISMPFPVAHLTNAAMIDRTRGAGEITKDVLIVHTPRQHGFDERNFPRIKLLSPRTGRHGDFSGMVRCVCNGLVADIHRILMSADGNSTLRNGSHNAGL